MSKRFYSIAMFMFLAACAMGLAGCATAPSPAVVQVTGNNTCHPSSDLPAHKVMKKVPENDTFMDDLFALFGVERASHAADIKDYNSLYDECVAKQPVNTK